MRTTVHVPPSHFSRAIIDEAIDEWRKRLLACVRMKGHYFEHLIMFAAKTWTFWSSLFELCWSCGHTVAMDRVAGYVPWLPWQLLQLVFCFVNNFCATLQTIYLRLTAPNFIISARFLWELWGTICVPHFFATQCRNMQVTHISEKCVKELNIQHIPNMLLVESS